MKCRQMNTILHYSAQFDPILSNLAHGLTMRLMPYLVTLLVTLLSPLSPVRRVALALWPMPISSCSDRLDLAEIPCVACLGAAPKCCDS